MNTLRIIIYAANVMALFGCSEATANRVLGKIHSAEGKNICDPISVGEFCKHKKLKYPEVLQALNPSREIPVALKLLQ